MRSHFIFVASIAMLSVLVLLSGARAELRSDETNSMTSVHGAELSGEAFLDPPMETRPSAYWNWLNGNVDRETLTRDLKEAREKGMGGMEIWDVGALSNTEMIPSGPRFLSEDSVADIQYALEEGRRLGMRLSMIASSGWNAGGSWVEPDWALKHLYFSSLDIKGPASIERELPFPQVSQACPKRPDGRPVYHQEAAVLAVPKRADRTLASTNEVIDLTSCFEKGQLSWQAPAGEWVVLRFVCSNAGQKLIAASPKSEGLFIDFLEPTATIRHFRYILDRLGITPENADASGLSGLELDSMEMGGGIHWTDRFPEYFQHWCGYDPIPYLPVLAGWKIEGITDAFRYDYRKAVSEQLIFSHYTTGRDFLSGYGLELVAEAGGPAAPISPGGNMSVPVDSLKALGNVSKPRGEFWIQHKNIFLVKEVASAAHIYGLPVNDSEAFTTWRRWKDGPFALKQLADRAFCEGLNHFNYHGFAHSPPELGLPGRAYHAGVDINPQVTWWEQARPFFDYLARGSYMLRQGTFVADVCAYYGDQAPNYWPFHHNVPEKPRYPGLDAGYDYDVINSDVILNRLSVVDGRIMLPDGLNYRLLVLPNQNHIPVEVLEKIAGMVESGAIILGPKPIRDPRLDNQPQRSERVRQLADQLWGGDAAELAKGRSVGRGKVFSGPTPTEVLDVLGVMPDFRSTSGPPVDFIHRRTAASDIYYVRNTGLSAGMATCHFRVQGLRPELWDPVTGKTGIAIPFRQSEEGVVLDLPLAPGGAVFVVFRPVGAEDLSAHLAQPVAGPEVAGPWTLRFPDGWGATSEKVLTNLVSWTDFSDHDNKYFSGTASYETDIELSEQMFSPRGRVYLDLGDVRELAEVFLNDQPLGVVWQPPFRVDLTPAARAGQNRLVVKVTNLWTNRLYGDHTTTGKRYTWTNSIYDRGGARWEPLTSGLLGPVRLLMLPAEGQSQASSAELPVVVELRESR